MKIFKRAVAFIFCTVFVCAASGVSAQPLFNASVSLSSDLKSGGTTYLSYNESFDVALHLKTGANYYAGPFSAQVFYSGANLKVTPELNKSGKLYSRSSSYCSAADSASMTAKAKSRFFPRSWSDTEKSKYKFCNVSLVPNAADSSTSVDNLDENVAVLHFTAGTAAGDSKIFVSSDSVKTASNSVGQTYLSCLTDNGKVGSTRYDYGTDAQLDLSGAVMNVVVSDAGDIDNNKKLNSTDALMILQHVVEMKTQTGDALKRCDTDRSGSVGSADALAVLQIATGLMRLNDIIKR